jgi:catechol 2,3-dioxygenase-like lactoylglutathione lyase family enzyme
VEFSSGRPGIDSKLHGGIEMSKSMQIFIGVLVLISVIATANESRSDNHPLEKHILGIVTMLAVNDLDKSVAFYRDKLGFEVRSQSKHIAGLTSGSMNLYLFTKSPPTPDKPTITLENLNKPGSTSVVIDIIVKDCRAAYEELVRLGVEFLTPPNKPFGMAWRCFAKDPDGYLIEIEEDENSPFFRVTK